jgi:hypothetical protein
MNRTSASVITLAIILSMVATPAFRSSSNRGTGGTASKTEDAKKRQAKFGNAASNQKQCGEINSFAAELYDTIGLVYPQDLGKNGGGTCPQDFKIPASVKTQVMLAVVPDPKHTNLALLFDRQMDALQQGIQDAGWTFDRALMPWDSKEAPQFNDFISSDLEQKTQDAKEEEPGLLIFRRDNDRLLVFVIGESPTGGIHKDQFQRASWLVSRLFSQKEPSVLGIFGPTFSGSLASLSDLLHCGSAFPCGSTHILDFSGTVTSRSAVTTFAAANSKVVFASFENYDDNAIDAFLKFAVNQRNYCPSQIAILSEDESAYGASGYSGDFSSEVIEDQCPKEGNAKPVSIFFPREISHLRDAYQQNLTAAAQASNLPGTTLPLDLESPGSNDDTVPEYSHKQMPLSQESVLLGIAAELRYRQVQLIILRATDSLDQLFLAHYLRGAYPAGRIVILNADLLFQREIQDSALHGIMALSTYSLIPGANQSLLSKNLQNKNIQVDRVFPSSDSMGTYNASKLLTTALNELWQQPKKLGRAEICGLFNNDPFNCVSVPPSDDATDTGLISPNLPIHVTVLGHDGFADVAVLSNTVKPPANSLQMRVKPVEQPQRELPNAWHLFWVMVVIVALAYCYFLLSASMLSSSEAVAHLAPPQLDSRVWLFGVNTYLHFALLLTVLIPFFYFKVSGFEKWSLMSVMALVGGVGIYDLHRRKARWLAYLLLCLCLVTSGAVAYYLVKASNGSVSLFITRAVQLTSGVSPLLPVLFLLGSGLWGAWHSLSSSSLVDSRRPALPSTKYLDPARKGQPLGRSDSILEDDNRHLFRLLRANSVEGRAVVATFVIVAAVWWYRGFRPLQTLESNSYEYLLAMAITCVAVLLLSGILRLQSIWAELKRLLVALDSLPLRRGFKRLDGFSWSPMWRVGAGNLSELRRLLSRQLESLRCLENLAVPGFDQEFQDKFLNKAVAVRDAYKAAKSNYEGYSVIQASPTQAAAAVAATQNVGGGAAVKLVPELPEADVEPENEPTPQKGVLRWLRVPAKWIEQVLRQGNLERTLLKKFSAFQRRFAKAGSYALAFCETQWSQETSIASNGEDKEGSEKIADALEALARRTPEEKAAAAKEEKLEKQLHACEEFVALLYTSFILVVLVRIRGLIVAAGGMYVLLLAALNVYPFQPEMVIRSALIGLLVVIVGIVGFVYAQMHRDSTLSYITGTEPGELGLNFWIRIVSFVAVPAISLLASQFPQIAGLFSSWVEPAVNALK